MNAVGSLVCPIIVGRDHLLEHGERRLREAAAGRGHLLFLAGEAGIGKSRLLGATMRRAAELGFHVADADVGPRDLEVPAAAVLDLSRSLMASDALRPTARTLFERLTAEGAGDPATQRRLIVHDVVDILAALPTPCCIAFENLQWADDLALEIIATLARRLPQLPILVIATYRSDELYPRIPMREWRTRLMTQRLAEEARLGRLSVAETATMANLLLESDLPAPREFVDAVHDRTDGIPLHVEELLGMLRAGAADAPGRGGPPDAVPDTIETAVRERLERRSPRARALAEAGAVIGRCFVLDVAAGVMDEPVDALSEPLRELLDHFFLFATSRPGLYDFRHVLIRDAIYGSVPDPDRRRMHARVAELGEGLPGAGEAFKSAHFEQAGRAAEAFRAALSGARAAARISAHRAALELYRRALRNVPPDLPTLDHARILEATADEAAASDDNAAASELYVEARARYRAAGRRVDAAALAAPWVAARHLLGDDLPTRVEHLQAALRDLDGEPPGPAVDAARLRLLAGLSAAYMLDRRLDPSIEHGRTALALAQRLDDEGSELHVLATLGSDLVFAGQVDEGWAMLESAVGRARAAQREAEAGRAYRMLGSCASVLVEYGRAERFLREGIEYAERVELWNDRHYMAAHLGHVLWATGRWDAAADIAAHALADGRGGLTTRITALHVLGYVALGRGDQDRARAALDEARDLGQAMGELQRLSPALWGLAELAILRGDADAAGRWCAAGRELSAAVDDAAYLYPFLVTGTRAFLMAGEVARAEGFVADVAERLRRRSIPGTLPAIDHATGLLLLAGGSTGRARVALEAALAGWTAARRGWERAAVQVDLATAMLRINRAADAVRLAEAALAAAEAMGSHPLADRARSALQAGRARHPGDEPWAPLTGREFAVARLVADGRTNAQIADELGISRKTVSAHVEHILAKLGADRRAEIARWAATVDPAASGTPAASVTTRR